MRSTLNGVFGCTLFLGLLIASANAGEKTGLKIGANAPAFMLLETIGHTSMPPDAKAMEISIQLSIKNFTCCLLCISSQTMILECWQSLLAGPSLLSVQPRHFQNAKNMYKLVLIRHGESEGRGV